MRHCALPEGRAFSASGVDRPRLQRAAVDADAQRRAFRRRGGAGVAGRRHAQVLPALALTKPTARIMAPGITYFRDSIPASGLQLALSPRDLPPVPAQSRRVRSVAREFSGSRDAD